MSGHSLPVYLPSGSTAGAFRNATMGSHRNHSHGDGSQSAGAQLASDHNAIEPSLASLSQQTSFSSGMSRSEERVFELQLQAAAAAAAANDEITPSTVQVAHDHAVKQRRLGRACDACSKRKVKCGDEVPCRNCVDIGVPCTFIRPAKRRGPANRVAVDLKRARYEADDLNTEPIAHDTASSSITAMSHLNLESVAPFETVHRMLYDFFTYVYPIFPFPHEHLVMERLRKREDTQNKSFCALVSSLLAALSAVFPRLAQRALDQQEQNGYVIDSEVLIGRCMLICEQSRGPLGSDRNVDDATTVFFIGLVCSVREQHHQVEMFLTEALAIVRFLGVERDGVLADGIPADFVTKELCRRIYWAIEIFIRSRQQGGDVLDIMPPRKASQLAPLPLAADDYYIYVDRIQEQPQGQLSSLEGFTLIARIYQQQQSLVRFDFLENIDDKSLGFKTALLDLDEIVFSGHPELAGLPNPRVFSDGEAVPSQQARMHIRWELQKIVLHLSLICTRVYLANRLVGASFDNIPYFVEVSKRTVHDIKELLDHLTRESVEPVAKLILPQLRQVLNAYHKASVNIEKEVGQMDTLYERFMELLQIL